MSAASAGAKGRDVDRAEELIENWGERVGGWLATAAARVREEAEDMWAEAQSIRRGEPD